MPEVQAHRRRREVEAPTIAARPRAEAVGAARELRLCQTPQNRRRERDIGQRSRRRQERVVVPLDKAGIDSAGGEIRRGDNAVQKSEIGRDAEDRGLG